MILEQSELIRLFHGAVDYVEENSELFPRRFTKAQLEVASHNTSDLIRAYASCGMVIAFETDATKLDFDYRVDRGSSQDLYCFDIWINGLLCLHHSGAITREPVGTVKMELPVGVNKVEIYLPHLAKTVIGKFELLGAKIVKPITKEKHLLCLGDSITQGYIAQYSSGTYTAILGRAMNADILNQGIGGERFHVEMLDPAFPWKPTHVLISYGTNDWSDRDRDSFILSARKYIDLACDIWKDTPFVLITPIWRGDALTLQNRPQKDFSFAEARNILEQIGADHPNIHVVKGEELFPPLTELTADGYVHPNDLGFTHYAMNLFGRLPLDWVK